MMKKLYHIYDPQNGNKVTALLSETVPDNSINHIVDGQIEPYYDVENDCIKDAKVFTQEEIEFLCNSEIEELREKTSLEISELLREPKERERMEGIEIPQEIHDNYRYMKELYNQKKEQILQKYQISINP